MYCTPNAASNKINILNRGFRVDQADALRGFGFF